jgi:DNA-binding NarL/FixJ family response regulator
VQDRLTNREIAERLVLSEKTIERHMSHILRKLGATSRVEVARALERSLEAAKTPN